MILSADTILDHKAVDAMCVLLPFTLQKMMADNVP